MTTYVTRWSMPQDDVNLVTSAGQWNSFALQVDGTNHPVTWAVECPADTIEMGLVEKYEQQRPICCDNMTPGQSVTYKPRASIHAKVGSEHHTGSIIANISDWAQVPIDSMESNFTFDQEHGKWTA